MPKLDPAKLEHYRTLDRDALEFANTAVADFFARATAQGYSLNTTGFLANPGFFQAPHRKSAEGVDIAMFGCPLDLGAIGLSGTRHAPLAVRRASGPFGPVHDVTGNIPFEQCNVIDYGDVPWSGTELQLRLQDITETVHPIAEAGALTLSCGGEHTSTFGVLRALSRAHGDEAFGLIQIDAHCDTMAAWGGDVVNDGSVFRQAVLNGFIDPERTVQIGIRGRANFYWEFSEESGMTVITADEVHAKGIEWVLDKAREIVGQDKTYLSFDVDSIDSGIMMGTTGPEPFGLSPRQVRDLILGARGLNIIGADMVELNPSRDPNMQSTHLAAGMFFELLALLADAREAQTGRRSPTNWV